MLVPLPAIHAATSTRREGAAVKPPAGPRPTTRTRLPLRFERAPGDPSGNRFVARGAGYVVGVTGREATVGLKASGSKGAAVTMRLVGSQQASAATARKPLPGVTNHLLGNKPGQWQLGVRGHAEVEYRDVYPGVAIVYYGNEGQLEYDFVVAPGASHAPIALAFDGAKGVRIDGDGQLVIATHAGDLIQKTPVIYQEIGAERRVVEGGYVIGDGGTIGFKVGKYDPEHPLVIDPVLSYSTYLGGSAQERANGVVVDAEGNIVIVGETYSSDFPTVSAIQGQAGLGDVFIAKLTPSGDSLVYATYFGGGSSDVATGVDVDAAGNAFVVGFTWSWDFPTLNAVQSTLRGQSDSFVAKLDPAGVLVYSTLVGGLLEDNANGIAVDAQGRAHIVGSTISGNFPTVNPTQPMLGGNPASRTLDGGQTWTGMKNGLSTTGVLSFAFDPAQPSTMYAGTRFEGVYRSEDGGTTWTATSESGPPPSVYALAVSGSSSGTLYAATDYGVYRSADRGETWTDLGLPLRVTSMVLAADGTLYAGTSFSVSPGVLKSTDGGDTWVETGVSGDVQALAVSGSTVYATTGQSVFRSRNGQDWIPVSGTDAISHARVRAVDPVDPFVAYACGVNGLFKTTTGGTEWFPVFQGLQTAAVAIAPSDPLTIYLTTWFGDVGVSNDGGSTWRPTGTLPSLSETLSIHPQQSNTLFVGGELSWDAFVTVISADGQAIEFSTYLGGSSVEEGTGIAVDATGNTFVTGNTQSDDLPIANPIQATRGGLSDVFVAKLSATGALNYVTYLGGSGSEYHARIGVDAAGHAHVSGLTWSMFNFPVANAYQSTAGGGFSDVFVSVLNAAGNGFVYSTYLGGSDMENDSTQSLGPVLTVTPSGETYIAGTTKSADFPTTADALQSARAGVNDGFVARFDAAGQLRFSTFLGGTGEDNPRAITADAEGVVVTGYTSSSDWPTVSPLQPALAGTDDAFIARILDRAADTIAPETSVAISGTAGLGGWYRSPVQVTLSAADNPGGSGVSTIEFGLDAGAVQPYSAPFTIASNGVTVVTARATDNAGNIENPAKSISVHIDAAPPVVALTSLQARDYLHSDIVTLAVSTSDVASGVAPGSAVVSLDGGYRTVGEAINLRNLSLGTHTVSASASDVAGNPAQQTMAFRIIATIGSVSALVNVFADEGLMEDGARRTLLDKLAEAQRALDRGCAGEAREDLGNVIEYLTEKRGKKVAAEAADTLLTDTRYVRSAM